MFRWRPGRTWGLLGVGFAVQAIADPGAGAHVDADTGEQSRREPTRRRTPRNSSGGPGDAEGARALAARLSATLTEPFLTSARTARRGPAARLEISVAVNASTPDLLDGPVHGRVADLLQENGADGRSLVVEITESVYTVDLTTCVQVLGALREHGIRVPVDDHGTGCSSLAHRRELPLDELELDRLAGCGRPAATSPRAIA